MYINSIKINQKFLNEFNCPSNKSLILEFPNFIPDKFMPAFIAGYVSGDGGFCKSRTKPKSLNENARLDYNLGILGSRIFCEKLHDYLESNVKINCSLSKDKRTSELRTCNLRGYQTIHKFMLWLKKGCPYFLERKTKDWEDMVYHFHNKPSNKPHSIRLESNGIYKRNKLVWSVENDTNLFKNQIT
jgi:hypothetical protein